MVQLLRNMWIMIILIDLVKMKKIGYHNFLQNTIKTILRKVKNIYIKQAEDRTKCYAVGNSARRDISNNPTILSYNSEHDDYYNGAKI